MKYLFQDNNTKIEARIKSFLNFVKAKLILI